MIEYKMTITDTDNPGRKDETVTVEAADFHAAVRAVKVRFGENWRVKSSVMVSMK